MGRGGEGGTEEFGGNMVSTANKEGGIVRIVQNLTRELGKFYSDTTKFCRTPPLPPPPPPQVITDNSRGEVERRAGSILMLPSPMTKECFNERRDEEG